MSQKQKEHTQNSPMTETKTKEYVVKKEQKDKQSDDNSTEEAKHKDKPKQS